MEQKKLTLKEFQNYKLSMKESVSYGFAYFGGNILANMVAAFVTYYYTNSAQVAAAAVGTMILVSKILDGISDFLMALIIEKTNTKMGKAKPWFVFAVFPMAVSMVLLFSCPPGLSDTGKIIWMYATYIFCNVFAYTAVVLAMSTMLVLMTGDVSQRTKASAFGSSFGAVALIIVSSFTENMASAQGWFRVSLVYTIMAIISLIFPIIFCHERLHLVEDDNGEIAEQSKIEFKTDLPLLFKNQYFWKVMGISLLKFVVTGLTNGVAVYYFIYIFGNSAYYGVVSVLWFLPSMLLCYACPALVKKYGYKVILAGGFFMQTVGFFLMGIGTTLPIVYFGALMAGIGGTNQTVIFPLIGDAVDYGALKFGKQLTGLTNSGYSIGIKIGSGLGGALVGWILAASAFDASVAVQSAETLTGIRLLMGYIPAVVCLLSGILAWYTNVERDLKKLRGE